MKCDSFVRLSLSGCLFSGLYGRALYTKCIVLQAYLKLFCGLEAKICVNLCLIHFFVCKLFLYLLMTHDQDGHRAILPYDHKTILDLQK